MYDLIYWLEAGYSFMAMTNYPYPTSFMKEVPAWPANTSCIAMEDATVASTD